MAGGATMQPNQVRSGQEERLGDNELVAKYLDGETDRFRELVERYQARIVNFIQRSIGDRDRAEDLGQEVFIRVFRHIDRFFFNDTATTEIYTIASNLAKNELRNRSRNPLALFQTLTSTWDDDHRPLQFEDSSMRPDDLFRRRQLVELVERAADQLPPHHREVFILREVEGKSYEEIAEITNTRLGTVKSRLNRARTRFAQIIAPWLD
jgi:RNA polymerase sigma-70 factor (ECF subfamily)